MKADTALGAKKEVFRVVPFHRTTIPLVNPDPLTFNENPSAPGVPFGGSSCVTAIVANGVMVMVKVSVARLFDGSRAVQVTVVVPTGKLWMTSAAGSQITVTDPELSVAKGALKVTAAPLALVAGCVNDPKFSNRGGSVSAVLIAAVTVTTNVPVLVFPEGSRAVQVTVVEPIGKTVPEAGWQPTVAVPELSVAVVVNVAIAPFALVAVSEMFDGTMSVGA